MAEHGGWYLLCKFFDNLGPIPHHMHQMDEHAAMVGQKGKPEAYYFPPQYNFAGNNFPAHLHGAGARDHQGRRPRAAWSAGTRATTASSYHAKAYKLQPGTGWQIDAGILHAPGSLVTYEPQVNSDVFGMFQSMVEGRPVPWDLLVKDVPPEHHHDLDYIISMLDWDENVDPEFGKHNRSSRRRCGRKPEMADAGYREMWITLRQALLFGQGTDRPSGPLRDHHGCGRLRRDPDAGPRQAGHARSRDPDHDPVRRDDQGRGLRVAPARRRPA